ncbi:hypothetical protein GCM10010442_38000 [Kitasatospora kifunensis]
MFDWEDVFDDEPDVDGVTEDGRYGETGPYDRPRRTGWPSCTATARPGGSVATAPLPAAVLVNCPVSGDCYSAFGGVGGAAEFLPGVEVVLDALAPGGDQA